MNGLAKFRSIILAVLAGAAPAAALAAARKPLALPAVSGMGVSDASLASDGSGRRLWMSYSAVNRSSRSRAKTHWTVETRLAYSDDGGGTWKDLGRPVNASREVDVGRKAGIWNSEVSSLVYDPAAARGERWKLFWHHYLMIEGKLRPANGWIAYKSAGKPVDLASAREIKLFGAGGYKPVNDDPLGETASPVGGPPVVAAAALPELRGCVALTEPGAAADASGVYVALTCLRLSLMKLGVTNSVILLRCSAPCRAQEPKSWRFVSTLLTDNDAAKLGFDAYDASDIFFRDGKAYLIASPDRDGPTPRARHGCFLFRFESLERGLLEKSAGLPIVLKRIEGTPSSHNGACAYLPSMSGGAVYNEPLIERGRPPAFRLFQAEDRF